MSTHRYWRAVALEAYGNGDLEISEFHLLAGATRVDASATLTSSVAPASGALANLADDDTSTGATWTKADLRTLVLSWDFGGSPQDVTDIRVGAADVTGLFLSCVGIHYSDDGTTWTQAPYGAIGGITWPGARLKTASGPVYGQWSPVAKGAAMSVDATGLIASSASSTNSVRGITPSREITLQFEVTVTAVGSTLIGVATPAANLNGSPGADAGGYAYYQSGHKYNNNTLQAYAATYTTGDVIGVVYNPTTGTVTFYKNGTSQGVAYTLAAGTLVYPIFGAGASTGSQTGTLRTALLHPVAGAALWGSLFPIRCTPMMRQAAPIFVPTAASVPMTYGATKTAGPIKGRRDYNHLPPWSQGVGRVSGTVKEDGSPDIPVYRRVRLIRERDGLVIREAWSDKITGAYQFDYVDELEKYTVLSYDHTHNFRAVVGDNLTPTIIT